MKHEHPCADRMRGHQKKRRENTKKHPLGCFCDTYLIMEKRIAAKLVHQHAPDAISIFSSSLAAMLSGMSLRLSRHTERWGNASCVAIT